MQETLNAHITAVRGGRDAPHTFQDRPNLADLPPHPDTERLDWLTGSTLGARWTAVMYQYDCHELANGNIRAAIDAARTQAGKEGV